MALVGVASWLLYERQPAVREKRRAVRDARKLLQQEARQRCPRPPRKGVIQRLTPWRRHVPVPLQVLPAVRAKRMTEEAEKETAEEKQDEEDAHEEGQHTKASRSDCCYVWPARLKATTKQGSEVGKLAPSRRIAAEVVSAAGHARADAIISLARKGVLGDPAKTYHSVNKALGRSAAQHYLEIYHSKMIEMKLSASQQRSSTAPKPPPSPPLPPAEPYASEVRASGISPSTSDAPSPWPSSWPSRNRTQIDRRVDFIVEALAVDRTEAEAGTSPAAVSDMALSQEFEGRGFVPGATQHLNITSSRLSSKLAIETTLAGYEERRRRTGSGWNAPPSYSSSSVESLARRRREQPTLFPWTAMQQRRAAEEHRQKKQTWLSAGLATSPGMRGRY